MSTTNELPPGLTETNRDREMAWSIDVQADPYAIDIDLLNPAHNELFRANKVLPYFARLRAESPIHSMVSSSHSIPALPHRSKKARLGLYTAASPAVASITFLVCAFKSSRVE